MINSASDWFGWSRSFGAKSDAQTDRTFLVCKIGSAYRGPPGLRLVEPLFVSPDLKHFSGGG